MKKGTKVIFATVFLVLATAAITLYVRQYYLPMRDAKPLLELLKRGTPGDLNAVMNTLLDGPRLREPGASKVRQAVLRLLADTTDEARRGCLCAIIQAGQEDSRLLFKGKDEWDIIKAATERSDLKPCQYGVLRFFVTTGTNGVTYLNAGMAHPIHQPGAIR